MRDLLDASGRDSPTPPKRDATLTDLTRREIEVLGLIAEGATGNEIARRLAIAPTTTRNHTQNILRKLDATSQLDAVLKAAKLGLVNITGPTAPDS